MGHDEPFGFWLAKVGPCEVVCLDSCYIGKPQGGGRMYRLTAIDVFH